MRDIKKTKSLCPKCLRILDATIFEQDGRVLIKKECPEHGVFEDVYWSSYEEFVRAQKYRAIGDGIENPMTKIMRGHPFDCGICPAHKSHTALAIIDVTNRCVTGDTEVILEDGTIVRIEDLVNNKIQGNILSWRKEQYSTCFNKMVAWQKLEAPDMLVKIRTLTGEGIFTPDHELLVDTTDGPVLKRADTIKAGDRIYSVARIPVQPYTPGLIEILAQSDTNFFIYPKKNDEFRRLLKETYGSYINASQKLGIKYGRLISKRISLSAKDFMKLGRWILDALKINKVKYHSCSVSLSFQKVNSKFTYLLGLIESDGTVVSHTYPGGSVNYVAFDNKCSKLLEEFQRTCKELFPSVKIRKRENRLILNSLLLCEIVCALSIKKEKSFQRLFRLDESLIASYLAGYLDGDGHATLRGSEIAITSTDKEIAKRIQLLLKRLGITSSVNKIRYRKTSYSMRKYFYKCRIVGAHSKLSFIDLVNPRHPDKKRKLNKLRQTITRRGGRSYPDAAPMHMLREVKAVLHKEGLPITSLRDTSTLYKVWAGKRGCSKQYVQNQLQVSIKNVVRIPALTSNDYYLDEVVEIENLRKHGHRYVYDVTVNDTHLFVINGGFIVSNCNLRCPICFANAATAGYVYEPTKEQIRGMLENLRNIKPVPATALQYSGGEPTVREDLPELIKMAKELGFHHVEVDSNGIKLAESVDYCEKLIDAGISTVYLSFDGVKPRPYIVTRGRDLLQTKIDAIENCRKAGLDSIVLVPTVVKGVNDDQLGDIIKFAAKNFDVVRCVNFQPVSITGRVNYEERKRMRITIPECIKLIEEQTDGQIKTSDFYPVPFVVPLSRAVGALKGKRYVEFTCHEHCGMATFVFVEDDKLVPITHYADVDKFMETMNEVYEEARERSKTKAKLKMLQSLRYIKFGLLHQLFGSVLKEGTYKALGKLMRRMIMIGMMHFMDLYNFDLERVERCCIHYAVPDGRLIPFCTMNTIYRQAIEKKFSVPTKEWQKNTRQG